MKPLFLLTLVIFGFTAYAGNRPKSNTGPVANAGPDQTIYLTQTSSVTLDGSQSSGDSYQWTEVSTDYSSGATITSPNSAVTSVTGLPQGVWYFQLEVTSGGSTATDVVVVTVDYDVPPNTGTLLRSLEIQNSTLYNFINDRSTTSQLTSSPSGVTTSQGEYIFDRCRSNSMYIDDERGKFYSMIEDGYGWQSNQSYARTEGSYTSNFTFDVSKTYVLEWKGYFPQNFDYLAANQTVGALMQVHSNSGESPPFGFCMLNGIDGGNSNRGTPGVKGLYFTDDYPQGTPGGFHLLLNLEDMVDKTHTIRLVMHEGSDAPLLQVFVDGVEKYKRTEGTMSLTPNDDYPKFATLYDWANAIVDPANSSRGRQFSMVTESFKIYELNSNSFNSSPVANAGSDQTITLPTNSVTLSGSGDDQDGSISSYKWTEVSGSTANFTNPNSASTDVTDLQEGTYQFKLTVTDDQGATGTSTVTITAKAASNTPPTADAGSDQTVTLPTNSVTLSGSGKDSDGSISSYEWSEVSGSTANFTNPNSASTDVTDLQAGTYQFKLTVTDDKGATGSSTVTVTVKGVSNTPPTADAGSDQTITLPINSVTLSGSGKDQDGSISSYKWTEVSGSTDNFTNPNSATTDVTDLQVGTYQFKLTVTDDKGATGNDTVYVTVKKSNLSPIAHAGNDQVITLPTNSITLSGSATDSDGTVSSYSWQEKNGLQTGKINSPSSANTTVDGLIEGDYTFELTVTDNQGATGSDTIHVRVNPPVNASPTAIAGNNKTIILPVDSVTLKGAGQDVDGTIESYLWTKISGPAGSKIYSSGAATIVVSGLVQGIYQFELKVTDNEGAIGKDTVRVTVNAANNIPPIAYAGADKTITLPTNSVSLTGSGNDSDGSIKSYAWTKLSGPSGAQITKSSSPNTSVTDLVQGVYQFELTVTDDKGDVGSDTVAIKVNPAQNQPPIAHAGNDQTITLPSNSITLSGSGTDADGTIASYKWTKKNGPAGIIIKDSSSASTVVSGLVKGDYTFELTVKDDLGASGTDTVHIKVNSAQNQPPVAHAGNDQTITLPTNSITLSGSGTDEDGTIASYNWTQKNGPAGVNIKNSSSANTVVNGLVQGDYTFELTVKDDLGASGIDTIHIKVNSAQNQPPVAHAGNSQTITLPTNSVTLSGTGTDGDGTIASYKWTQSSGPSSANISKSTAASTKVTGLKEGVYVFKLTVTDDKGATATSTTEVTVNLAGSDNVAPTANAGTDQSITLPSNSIMLSGNGSDPDGSITSYQWKKISGPTEFSITNSSSQVANVTGLVKGEYVFELTVTDNKGAKGTSTVTVTVNEPANILPTANAGADQSVNLPLNNATLRGEGNDVDGTVVGYSWNQISGPSSGTINNPNSSSTVVSNLVEGIYMFELQVKDDRGGIGKDTLVISVNSNNTATNTNTYTDTSTGNENTSNSLPGANAGNDTTVIAPVQFVTLNGSGIDKDGNISGYSWRQISGPSASTILSDKSAMTNISGLSEGTYSFELAVTDNKGGIGKDTVNVTVALARYAPSKVKAVNIYPNPVHDIATLEVNTGTPNTNIGIVIVDISGRTVYQKEFVSSSTESTVQINMSNLIKGTYFVSVYFDETKVQTVKVLKL